MRSFGWQAAVALAAALFALTASAEVWQWTDAEGVVRYTPNPERVPASRRDSLIKLEPGMQVPPPSPSRPPVRYAPPEELPLGVDPFEAPEPARTLEPSQLPPPEPLATPEPARAPELPGPPGPPEAEPATTPRAAPGEAPAPSAPPVEEPEPPPPRPLTDAEKARRAELEEQIAAYQEALKDLLSQQSTEGGEPLRKSSELREIAQQLPALQAELRALEGVPDRRGEGAAPQP